VRCFSVCFFFIFLSTVSFFSLGMEFEQVPIKGSGKSLERFRSSLLSSALADEYGQEKNFFSHKNILKKKIEEVSDSCDKFFDTSFERLQGQDEHEVPKCLRRAFGSKWESIKTARYILEKQILSHVDDIVCQGVDDIVSQGEEEYGQKGVGGVAKSVALNVKNFLIAALEVEKSLDHKLDDKLDGYLFLTHQYLDAYFFPHVNSIIQWGSKNVGTKFFIESVNKVILEVEDFLNKKECKHSLLTYLYLKDYHKKDLSAFLEKKKKSVEKRKVEEFIDLNDSGYKKTPGQEKKKEKEQDKELLFGHEQASSSPQVATPYASPRRSLKDTISDAVVKVKDRYEKLKEKLACVSCQKSCWIEDQ